MGFFYFEHVFVKKSISFMSLSLTNQRDGRSSVSTPRLNALLHLHLEPIKPVIYWRTHGFLILRYASHLRCFQCLSSRNIATRRCSFGTTGTPGIPSSRSSRTKEESFQESRRLHWIESELSHDVLNPARVPL